MGLGSILQMETKEFPAWLEVLLKEKFFNACLEHEAVKKNEKNILCIDCCLSICPHCLPSHNSHRLLQVSFKNKTKFSLIFFQIIVQSSELSDTVIFCR